MKFNKAILWNLFASLSLANIINDNISDDVDTLISEVFNFDNINKMYVNNESIDYHNWYHSRRTAILRMYLFAI